MMLLNYYENIPPNLASEGSMLAQKTVVIAGGLRFEMTGENRATRQSRAYGNGGLLPWALLGIATSLRGLLRKPLSFSQ